ncbi:HAD family hydrolase [Vreelandella sp. EE27]
MSMKYNLSKYECMLFDCDGVILNSNRVKTDAFYKTALPYGEIAASRLVDYHVNNGGISRYKKFAYFLEGIAVGQSGPGLDELLDSYASRVRDGLMQCEIAPGLEVLKQKARNARWLIVSGGDQSELREVFAARGLDILFEGGIFGSPDTKDTILERELASGNITTPALFLGDSKYDYQAANAAGLDFVFMSSWSEVEGWKGWCESLNLHVCSSMNELY